jgi:hypothetical protein
MKERFEQMPRVKENKEVISIAHLTHYGGTFKYALIYDWTPDLVGSP